MRMVGAMAHPLNRAVIDPQSRIVTEGYGILQPRVGVSVQSASRSRLAAIYSGQTGFDIYTRAVSDAYQDLYGEGIFTGKGIYEVATLHAVLDRRFPRNSLLSHDLIEGAYARAGLATDIEVIDDYPSHYSAYTRRKHRWVRGDWQIAQWLFGKVPDESGRLVKNPISNVSRWKIFDNLRRSLVETVTLILLVAGWLGLPGGPLYWTLVTLILLFAPSLVSLVFSVARAWASPQKGEVQEAFAGFWPEPDHHTAQPGVSAAPDADGARCDHPLAGAPVYHRTAAAGVGDGGAGGVDRRRQDDACRSLPAGDADLHHRSCAADCSGTQAVAPGRGAAAGAVALRERHHGLAECSTAARTGSG